SDDLAGFDRKIGRAYDRDAGAVGLEIGLLDRDGFDDRVAHNGLLYVLYTISWKNGSVLTACSHSPRDIVSKNRGCRALGRMMVSPLLGLLSLSWALPATACALGCILSRFAAGVR